MEECLFCNIGKNKIESLCLYEDEIVKVILDAFPNKPGHTLIIPKKHYKDLDDINMDTLSHILKIAKEIKPLLEKALNPESIVLIQNNGEAEKIKHFHLHLLPYYKKETALSREEIYKLIMKAKEIA